MKFFMLALVPLFFPFDLKAQPNQQVAPIRVTEVRNELISQVIEFPGTVLSRRVSHVASEVAGLVEVFPVRIGDTVSRGDVLARLRTDSLELRLKSAVAQLREDEARMKLAERTLERARGLVESGVFSRQQLDDAQFEFDAWEGRIERLKVEIERLRDELDKSVIRAPFDAVVTLEQTQVGEWLAVGDPVVELTSIEDLEVAVDLPERYFAGVRPNTRATITFDSLPGFQLQGSVTQVIPQADAQARTFPVRLPFSNRNKRVGVGMLARVTIAFGAAHSGLVVPKDAVLLQGNERVLYVLDPDDTVRRVPVQTGAEVGQWVEVRGSLQAGQKVVTRGNARLVDGQKVRSESLEYRFP